MTEPSLGKAIGFSLIAIVCFAAVKFLRPPDFWSFIFTLMGIVMAVSAGACALDWLMLRGSEWFEAYQKVTTNTERVRILDYLSHLTPLQLEALNQYVPVVSVLGGSPEPVYELQTPGGGIPYSFIADVFLAQSGDSYLVPVSTWPEGTYNRIYAEKLTRYLITLGFAGEAIGNKPAKWLNKSAALKWIGLDDET